jgi:glycosyltransferase involved in cell wall biosynthesis
MNAPPPTIASRENPQPLKQSLDEVTPLILTFNEAPNLARTLSKLDWAREIVVIDSYSTDETVELARRVPQVRMLQRRFDRHADQWNYGLAEVRTEWVLTLDADYLLSDELVRELQAWKPEDGVAAYIARIRYCVAGKPLRGTLYPPRPVLFRPARCRYEQDGHTQHLAITGRTTHLRGAILHDDRKPVSVFLRAQDRYARLEAAKLLDRGRERLGLQDRIRQQIVIAPFLVFFYTLLGKGLVLDGWRGCYYALQRTLAEVALSLYLIEGKWRGGEAGSMERGARSAEAEKRRNAINTK